MKKNKQTMGAVYILKSLPLKKKHVHKNKIYFDQNIKYVEVVNFVTSRTNLYYIKQLKCRNSNQVLILF